MSLRVPFRNEQNIQTTATALTNASEIIAKNGGYTYDSIKSAESELKSCGIDLNQPGKMESMILKGKSKNVRTAAGQTTSLSAPNDSQIGIDTFAISNELIQDFSPSTNITESPLEVMLPYKSCAAVEIQQDQMSSFWGYAEAGTTVDGAIPVVELLEVSSNYYKGYSISEYSELKGNDIIALREVGTSDTARRGAQQRLNFGMLNLIQRATTGLELNRLESAIKGSWTWKSDGQEIVVSSQIPSSNIYQMSESLGEYDPVTNRLAPNNALSINPLVQLGQWLTYIKNTGLSIEKVVMDNVIFSTVFNCPAIAAQTQYISMNSNNDVSGIRSNLFKITTIPSLQDIAIEVDDRGLKFSPDKTTTLNTRPLWWGKTVTPSSFRALVVVRQSGLSRIGNFGFFPNIYARQGLAVGGTEGGIVAVQQDLSQFNILNQQIQLLVASNSAPMYYLSHGVYAFDFGVTIKA